MTIKNSPNVENMQAWRHSIHQNPELGFEEHQTSKLVAEALTAWGYKVTGGFASTGLVGQLVFGSGEGPRLGIRADMDALPIQEETGLPWASRNAGKMHACGHDGHTAILLGAAEVLAQIHASGEYDFSGTLNLIFQPAEEVGGSGGAQVMINDGLFEQFPCDAVFGLHNMPGIPVGEASIRPGPMMCSADRVIATFQGRGGHGAMPHLSVDPTLAAASTVMGLQTILGRNIDPFHTAVISVGRISAGQAYNVIPDQAEIELSVRALQPEVRTLVKQRICDLVQGQAAAYGCEASIDYQAGYPVLVNAEAPTEFLVEIARQVFGEAQVDPNGAPLSGSEDFAYMLQQVPGCYIFIGNGDNGHSLGRSIGPCSVHNPHYDFNDEILPLGANLWITLAQQFFKHGRSDWQS